MKTYRLFDFGPANNLYVAPVVSDDDYDTQIAWWLNGRVLGFYVSYSWKVWN